MASLATKDPGPQHAKTSNISFNFYSQRDSPAPFGYEYFLSLPPAYETSSEKYPLILFLHGSGESQRASNESYVSLRHGIPKVILCYDKLKDGIDPPHIKIPRINRSSESKQDEQGDMSSDPMHKDVCTMVAENFITVSPSLNMEHGYGWNASILSALLDEVVQALRVDLDRIHVTGFSMGGYGAWSLGIHSPARFATLSPICGDGDTVLAKNITHIPHWIFHGDLDDIVPPSKSLQMDEALQKAGAKDVKFTRYPEAKHDCWSYAYNNIELYKWMLGHRRKGTGDEIVVPEANKVAVAETGSS